MSFFYYESLPKFKAENKAAAVFSAAVFAAAVFAAVVFAVAVFAAAVFAVAVTNLSQNSKPKTKFSLDGVPTVVDVLSVTLVSSCLMHVLLSTLLLPMFLLLLTSLEFCWLVSLLLLPGLMLLTSLLAIGVSNLFGFPAVAVVHAVVSVPAIKRDKQFFSP